MISILRKPQIVVSTVALMVSVATVFMNNKQHKDQIDLASRNQKVQNLVSLGQYLHQTSFSDARTKIRENKILPHIQDSFVRRVCSSFGFAGSLVRSGAIDKQDFLNYWGSAIVIFDRTLPKEFWQEDASTGLGIKVSDYYSDFLWLINEENKLEIYKEIKHR